MAFHILLPATRSISHVPGRGSFCPSFYSSIEVLCTRFSRVYPPHKGIRIWRAFRVSLPATRSISHVPVRGSFCPKYLIIESLVYPFENRLRCPVYLIPDSVAFFQELSAFCCRLQGVYLMFLYAGASAQFFKRLRGSMYLSLERVYPASPSIRGLSTIEDTSWSGTRELLPHRGPIYLSLESLSCFA